MYDFNNAHAQIENTTLCGASCIMCPRDRFEHKLEMMSMAVFRKIIDEVVKFDIKHIGYSLDAGLAILQ